MTARLAGRGALIATAAAALGAFAALVAVRVGPWALALPAAAAAVPVMLLHPRAVFAGTLIALGLFELDEQGFLSPMRVFYSGLPGGGLRLHELLLALCAAGVGLRLVRERRSLRLPGPFTLPLLVLAVAIAGGVVMGWLSGGDHLLIVNSVRDLSVLVVVPFIAVNVIEGRDDVLKALALVAGVVAVKTVVGAAGWLLGQGREVGGSVLTYYAPLPNFLLMLFALGVFVAALTRVELPRLAWLLAPAALAVLVLSFRRNFWIAAVVAAVLVLLVVGGARGRWLIVPATVAVAIGLFVGYTALSSSQSQSPIIERAQSLAPSRLTAEADDRYRLDEQRNVRDEIVRHPVTGIGLGVPWRVRHPLAVTFVGGRDYTHTVVLWFWLKLGLLGLVAYLLLMVTAVRSAFGLWRTGPDPRLRIAGLALAAGLVGLAIAETTGSFTGVETRLSVFLGATFGWLAVARGD